jgi:hypothetical protein
MDVMVPAGTAGNVKLSLVLLSVVLLVAACNHQIDAYPLTGADGKPVNIKLHMD